MVGVIRRNSNRFYGVTGRRLILLRTGAKRLVLWFCFATPASAGSAQAPPPPAAVSGRFPVVLLQNTKPILWPISTSNYTSKFSKDRIWP